jgi:hypothetical protein
VGGVAVKIAFGGVFAFAFVFVFVLVVAFGFAFVVVVGFAAMVAFGLVFASTFSFRSVMKHQLLNGWTPHEVFEAWIRGGGELYPWVVETPP